MSYHNNLPAQNVLSIESRQGKSKLVSKRGRLTSGEGNKKYTRMAEIDTNNGKLCVSFQRLSKRSNKLSEHL